MNRDDEIRAELAEQVDREGRSVIVDSPDDGPPLMLVAQHRLKPEAIVRLRQSWEAVWRGDYKGPGPRLMVLEAGLELFQLIDGEWRKLE